MPPSPANPWQALLATEADANVALMEYRMLAKHSRPWLLLPLEARLARQALALYPAQSAKARLAKAALRLCLTLGWVPGAERLTLRVTAASAFAQFLQKTAGTAGFPPVASLAGNPTTSGQRLVLMLFDDAGNISRVVKVGGSGRAMELIGAEVKALRALAGVPGVPELRAEFSADIGRAFALDFFPGESPSYDSAAPEPMLTAWIRSPQIVRLGELPALQRLRESIAPADWLENLTKIEVRPVIMHGDFTPWNVKVSARDGSWQVLDWERGEPEGVPGWDWFHFVIQSELLVKRRAPEAIAQTLRALFGTRAFQTYAATTKISGHEQVVLQGYLTYVLQIIRPSEGEAAIQRLLELVTRR